MQIALIGATGFVGGAVLTEALSRGHAVTALTREPSRLAPQDGLALVRADAMDTIQVTRAVRGAEAVISAYNPGWTHPNLAATYLAGSRAILDGVRAASVARFLVVGGAGSLYVAPDVQLVDTPAFLNHVPPNVVPGAQAARDFLAEMHKVDDLDWAFLSPPAALAPGERSGHYRVGGEQLLMTGDTPAGISVADLAVAIVDELERPAHHRRRFTVASV